jgi:hypothetical protein
VQDKLILLCRLYENTSKTTGGKYFVGNLSFTAKLLLLENKDAVASVESPEEVKKIRDKAEVFPLYLKYHTTGADLQDLACEIKARADRRMGELLSALKRRPGTRTDRTSSQNGKRSEEGGEQTPEEERLEVVERPPLAQFLADLNIGTMEAWR